MMIGRNILLWASKNEWMKSNVPKFRFVQKAVKRFMPGEKAEDAINAAGELSTKNVSTTLTLVKILITFPKVKQLRITI